jgi:Fic family protein
MLRSVPWDANLPYNALPGIPDASQLETTRVLKAVIGARAELARLDQAIDLMPDPHVLLNTIPLLEAQASSEIENIVTTTDALFRHVQLDERTADPAVKETLRYRTALWTGHRAMAERALTTRTAVDVCSQIKGRRMDVRSLPGTRITDADSGRIAYAPPEGEDLIRDKLAAWERFVHADDELDPVVRMAAAHYQFEAIHPFTDGNGRTGRILNILVLVQTGVLREPILYLSRPIIDTKADYYRRLRAVTQEGAWEEWLLYMVDAVRCAAATTSAKIRSITQARDEFVAKYRRSTPGMDHAEFRAALFSQPYARISQVIAACQVSRPTATSWLNALERAGALESVKIGRDRLFLNTGYLAALTAS